MENDLAKAWMCFMVGSWSRVILCTEMPLSLITCIFSQVISASRKYCRWSCGNWQIRDCTFPNRLSSRPATRADISREQLIGRVMVKARLQQGCSHNTFPPHIISCLNDLNFEIECPFNYFWLSDKWSVINDWFEIN